MAWKTAARPIPARPAAPRPYAAQTGGSGSGRGHGRTRPPRRRLSAAGPPAAFPLSPGQGRGGRLLFGEPRELWSLLPWPVFMAGGAGRKDGAGGSLSLFSL